MEQRTRRCIPGVQTSGDKMIAQMCLQMHETGQELSVKDLKDFLARNGVKAGIKDETLCDMIEHDVYGVYVEVARGKEPVNGKEGYFVYHVENPENSKKPNILEDGTVEYMYTEEYTIVEEGELLAEYVPATNGIYGYTVENTMRAPARGKNLPPLKGKGFRIEEGKYYASKKGKVEITDSSIYITDLLEIKGDVDINSGHINFVGDVDIQGDVHSGMTVKATGNIQIRRHVGNCMIEAGGNITIKEGMQGKSEGRLKAGGDIYCKFFENAYAQAEGNIYVRSVVHSKLEAKGKIKVEGKDSVVLGGSLYATQGMELTKVGNMMEVATKITVGALPEMLSKVKELNEKIEKAEEDLALLKRSTKILNNANASKSSKEHVEWRKKIEQAQTVKTEELNNHKNEKIKNEIMMDNGKDAQVIVQNVIFPGCRIEIADMGVDIREKIKHVKFVLKDGNIEADLLY